MAEETGAQPGTPTPDDSKDAVRKALAGALLSRVQDEESPGRTDEDRELEGEPQEPGEHAAEAEPQALEEEEGGGDEEGQPTPPPRRSQERIRELAGKVKEKDRELQEAQKAAAEARAMAEWLCTPAGQAHVAAQAGHKPAETWDFTDKTDAEIAQAMLQATARQTRDILFGEMSMHNALTSLSEFKDFDLARDGAAVRQILASGAVKTVKGAYFAAFPERVHERSAHGRRREQSQRTTPPAGTRPTQPRTQEQAAEADYEQTVSRARGGDRDAFRALLRKGLGAIVGEGQRRQ